MAEVYIVEIYIYILDSYRYTYAHNYLDSKTVSYYFIADFAVAPALDDLFTNMQNGTAATTQYAELVVSVREKKIKLGTTYDPSTPGQTLHERLNEIKTMYTNIVVDPREPHVAIYNRGEGIKPVFVVW